MLPSVTANSAADAATELHALLIESVTDYAIFALDPDGVIVTWNRGAARLKGYAADEIIGQHFSCFYPAGDLAAGKPAMELSIAAAEGRFEDEGWRIRKDGTRFWANVVLTALRRTDGRLIGFGKVTRDLTERKRVEDALRGVLDRERGASERLRELDHLKNDLVAVIAHDLREPICVVQSLLHLFGADWDATTEADKLGTIDRISVRMQTLGALVDDVFDIARIEAGQLRVDQVPVDLRETIARVVSDVAATAPGRVIEVALDDSRVVGDGGRTLQVLTNLVSNAMKYSPPDTPVVVRSERIRDEVVVSVVDRGAGIPVEQLPLLFQRFSRLPQSSGTPGSGVGLFIARSLVEAQHGRLWVDSTPGTGSAFRFTLPAAAAADRP
jgi:PAS domain S-box-containing protein